MKNLVRKTLLGLAVVGISAQPAQACWNAKAGNAAKVMHLNNMLMVSALRCRRGNDNFLAEYNKFIKVNRSVISSYHGNAKQHFISKFGAKKATNAMDRFNISLANRYGAGHPSMSCGDMKLLAKTLSTKQSSASLLGYADRKAGMPSLPGGSCSSRIASAK